MNDDIEKSHSHSIRFPQELYERIHQLAKRGMRSFNSQVIFLLMRGIDEHEKLTMPLIVHEVGPRLDHE